MISMLKAPKTDIFYKKFSSITRWKLWHQYLEFVYKRTIIDAIHMNIAPISERKKPMCLLCGASGEVTAEEFIEFTLRSNNKSKILIIDIGSPQILSIKTLINRHYGGKDVSTRKADALHLSFIKNNSIDWIDTDGFLVFFNDEMLKQLVREWKRILKNDGYITFRECTGKGLFGVLLNKARLSIGRKWMKLPIYEHTIDKIQTIFEKEGFSFLSNPTFIPTFNRFVFVNK